MCVSFSKSLGQVCFYGLPKDAEENKPQLTSQYQSSACITSANIPLAKQVTWFSPVLRGRTAQTPTQTVGGSAKLHGKRHGYREW